ncbi:unnamed protein product [Cylicostephanus goldi]|uniref:PABS domain-containing protein n=1 Tax=Cylicostephanus goldi TaxID=71465 RepID=A0A3P6S4R8_CYLGO|nr:unnamed protein product [Cylicostephanus goldi]
MNIKVVEIDEVMVNISRKWFGLNPDGRQRVIIEDGAEFVRTAVREERRTYNVIYLDACTVSRNGTLNCPPDNFLSLEVVSNFRELLNDRGILIIHVMSDSDLKDAAIRVSFGLMRSLFHVHIVAGKRTKPSFIFGSDML